jgi:hypothetical protein
VLSHTFSVRNVGAKEFTVRSVKKSCSCESIDVAAGAVIPAGGVLEVTYALSKYGFGERNGKVVIQTDSETPALQTIELTLHAEVQPKLWATPAEIELSDTSGGEQILRIESIVPGLLDRFRDATTNRGNVLVTVDERSPTALALRAALAPDAPWGTFYDLIYLSFASREHPSLNVRVKGRKGHPLAVIPAVLNVSAQADGRNGVRTVRIMSPAAATGLFRIVRVDCPEGVVIDELASEARNAFQVRLAFDRFPTNSGEHAVVFYTEPPGAATLMIRFASPIRR